MIIERKTISWFYLFATMAIYIMLMAIFLMFEYGAYKNNIAFVAVFLLAMAFFYYWYGSASPVVKKLPALFNTPAVHFLTVITISSCLFFLLPRIIFDDAAIILRYMDNFNKGYWFRYNITDKPVYGISGFLHGLLGGILSVLHVAKPAAALYISNYVGFVATAWFTCRILEKLITPRWLSLLVWFVIITSSGTYLNVATSGLETPLHLAFICGAIYFLIVHNTRLFFFFTALMIISKLDAVPVAAALLFYYFVLYANNNGKQWHWRKESIWLAGYFFLPLMAAMIVITALFESPLPQSAYAKLYFHGHPAGRWFPFLSYFLIDRVRFFLLISGSLLWLLNLAEAVVKKSRGILLHGVFGSLFFSILTLYYFYNPDEQMIWYYSMPELLLFLHIIYTMYYFTREYFPRQYRRSLYLFFVFLFSNVQWKFVIKSFDLLQQYENVVEQERKNIGLFLAVTSSANDTLMAAHGLPARLFKGYVIDISGLNSRMATDYRLNIDSIAAAFKPNYIVYHSFPALIALCNQYNYKLLGLYRDITIYNYPSWAVFQKSTGNIRYRYGLMDTALNKGCCTGSPVLKLASVKGIIILRDNYAAAEKILHLGVNSNTADVQIYFDAYRKGVLLKSGQPWSLRGTGVSKFVQNIGINLAGADSVVFKTKNGGAFELIEPVYEMRDSGAAALFRH